MRFLLPVALVAGAPGSLRAGVSAVLSWNPSADPDVAGYNIYYGTACHQYTNLLELGDVTNVVMSDLAENTIYYFAAKAVNSLGEESDFSNEAAFAGFTSTPDANLRLKTLLQSTNSDPLSFSLAAGAPPGAVINPTNGIISWTPGRAYASTTNYLTVMASDATNPAMGFSENVVIVVSDYLDVEIGSTALSAGQGGSLPVTLAASSTVTNIQFLLNWPLAGLPNPMLTFAPGILSGSLQVQAGGVLVQLQTAPDRPLTGTNPVAQISFQTLPGATSAIFPIAASAVSGNTADGAAYANLVAGAAQVVVVGDQPILNPQADPVAGRSLLLYANPGTYALQYTTSLVPPVIWTTLQTYAQTNVAQTVAVDSANPTVFYRLQQF